MFQLSLVHKHIGSDWPHWDLVNSSLHFGKGYSDIQYLQKESTQQVQLHQLMIGGANQMMATYFEVQNLGLGLVFP